MALEDDAQWQAPAYCFLDDDDDEEGKSDDDDDGEEVGDGFEAAVKLLRELAGAAAMS